MPVIAPFFRHLRHLGLGFFFMFLATTARGEAALLDYYQQLKSGLRTTLPGTHINLVSSEQDDVLSAEVNSILHTPFETVAAALIQADNWCQVMPLHFNIKACTHGTINGDDQLTVYSGRKIYETPEDSYQMTYQFEVIQRDESQLSLRLRAEHGPVGTSDYLIELDAMPVAEGTLLHIRSSYQPSWLSSMLTSTYLSTLGRDKVGFSLIDQGGELHPVKGIKGIIERNVMRYQLAIDTFLSTHSLPKATRHETALASWFAQNEVYADQLHEMDEAEYLEIKRAEWQNQQRLQRALDEELQLASAPYFDDEKN